MKKGERRCRVGREVHYYGLAGSCGPALRQLPPSDVAWAPARHVPVWRACAYTARDDHLT